MLKIYRTQENLVAVSPSGGAVAITLALDELFKADNPHALAVAAAAGGKPAQVPSRPAAPIQSQEVWAAGVTYYRSRTARMAESKEAGGGTFYDKVYSAERPELFFKSTPHRVAGPGEPVRLRGDSKWNVPEPELTLAINSRGRIFGYTIGNDMSSRDIEGENPLYLPQAKVYDQSAALGPCLLLTEDPLPPETQISIEIHRGASVAFKGSTAISQIKRTLPSLAEYLFRDNSFPNGCFLMTGTGVVPADDFTLRSGDAIHITIQAIGTLVNSVA
jgi:2-dehydro-3-deoxy-D-arabinonate dehydratase